MATAVSTPVRLTPKELKERIARLPRLPLAFTPTPLEDCPRLATALGGPRLLLKRDDLTGFAFGGNKVRAMEFRLADLRAKGCDALVLVNIGQSNHARLHAAACARLGLKIVIVKPGPRGERVQGNLLLIQIAGAEVVECGTSDPKEVEQILEQTLEDLRKRGHKPYVHTRDEFSPMAGTVGYTEASIELTDQLHALGIQADHVFGVAGSSTAGLALGGKLLGASYHVHAVSVGGDKESILQRELKLSNGVAEILGLPRLMEPSDFTVHDEYVGDKYGVTTEATLEAIRLAARTEGIYLDPVYTGKAFSGLIGEIRTGAIGPDETVVFLHSGGTPIIFAYDDVLKDL